MAATCPAAAPLHRPPPSPSAFPNRRHRAMETAVAALTPLFLSHLSGLLGLIFWWRRGVIFLLGIRHRFINPWSSSGHLLQICGSIDT